MYPILRLGLVLSLVLIPMTSTALPTDNQLPIHIVADSWSYNSKTGVYTYEGNVKVDQGSTHLIADRLVTSSNTQHKMKEAIAYGLTKLAEYNTIPKKDDLVFQAKARVIKFYPLTSTVILQDDVVVTQGVNSFKGPNIIYNMKDQTVTAPASTSGRATIVIDPKQLKS